MESAATKDTEEVADQAKSFGWGWPVLVFGGLLLLYFLSTGPVARAYAAKPAALPTWVRVFYAPLMYACDHCPPAGKALEWYVGELWLPKTPTGTISIGSEDPGH